MTHSQRNAAIRELLEKHTADKTTSRAAARQALEGIYTKKGELRVEYGGVRAKAKTAA